MSYRLIFDNALSAMQTLIEEGITVDAVVTDPPYGTTACKWDIVIPPDKMWQQINKIKKVNAPVILFGNEPFSSLIRLSNINEYKYDIYWVKERLTNVHQVKKRVGKTVENIMIYYSNQCYYNPQMTDHNGPKRSNKVKNGTMGLLVDGVQPKKVKEYKDTGKRYPVDVWKFQRDILTLNIHPTQKPVKLMEELILTYTREGDTVLDFTCGSGTTGVACRNTNRNCILIDNGVCDKEGPFKDWKWIDVAKWRLEKN